MNEAEKNQKTTADKAQEQKQANDKEQKMVKLYMELTGCTEASARNVVVNVDETLKDRQSIPPETKGDVQP